MDNGELLAVLATDTLPLKTPVVVGAKATLKLAVCPDARLTGMVSPLRLK